MACQYLGSKKQQQRLTDRNAPRTMDAILPKIAKEDNAATWLMQAFFDMSEDDPMSRYHPAVGFNSDISDYWWKIYHARINWHRSQKMAQIQFLLPNECMIKKFSTSWRCSSKRAKPKHCVFPRAGAGRATPLPDVTEMRTIMNPARSRRSHLTCVRT